MSRIRISLVAAGLLAGAATVAAARSHGDHDGPHGWAGFAERHDGNGDGAVTREELASTSERFARLDENADGRVTEDEFRAALAGRVLGHLALRADEDGNGELAQAEWSAFLEKLDEDGDGALDLRHRRRGPGTAGEAEGEAKRDFPGDTDGDGRFAIAEAEALFARFDDDRDGVLSEEELPFGHGHHGHFGHRRHGMHGDRAGYLLRLDTDGDGSVSRAEWDAHAQERQDDRADRRGELFERLDANGDGALSREEIGSARPRGPRGRR